MSASAKGSEWLSMQVSKYVSEEGGATRDLNRQVSRGKYVSEYIGE